MSDLIVPPSSVKILGLWFGWVLATTVGLCVAWSAVFAALAAIDYLWILALCVAPIVLGASIGIMQGLFIGFMQRLVLRSETAWRTSFRWIYMTTGGIFLGFYLGASSIIAESLQSRSMIWQEVWLGAAFGFLVGYVQWRILRMHFLQASLWIWVNTMGWAIGFTVSNPLSIANNEPFASAAWRFGLAGVIIGGITGILLIWLFQHPKSRGASPFEIRNEANSIGSN